MRVRECVLASVIAACCRRVVRNRFCAARVCASPWAWRATDHSQFSTNRAIVRSFLFDCVGLADPLSRLSFFRTTTMMERYVRVCASVCCADYAVINIPCGWCQGRTRRPVNSGHMYIMYDSCCLYTRKSLARDYKSEEKDIRYYQCVNSVSRSNANVKKRRVRHHVAGTKKRKFLRIEWDRAKLSSDFEYRKNEIRAMARNLWPEIALPDSFFANSSLSLKKKLRKGTNNFHLWRKTVNNWCFTFMEYRRKIHWNKNGNIDASVFLKQRETTIYRTKYVINEIYNE